MPMPRSGASLFATLTLSLAAVGAPVPALARAPPLASLAPESLFPWHRVEQVRRDS